MRNLILIVYVLALPLARATQDQFNVPQGYTLEALEPFGGKVARPNGWFFHVGAGPHAYSWEISKEDPSKGDWDTGLQIQLMVSIKELTKLSPKAFMQQLIDQKKAAVNVKKVLKECGETDLGFFHRRCLEVEEEATTAPPTRYHVLYSLFWSDQSDLAASPRPSANGTK